MSERGLSARLDDRPSSITAVLNRATNRVRTYLMPNYREEDLLADATNGGPDGTGGMVKDLATDLAVCELARRRGNAVAQTWKDVCKEAMEMLNLLKDEQMQLPGVQTASPQYPAVSNVNVNLGYVYRKVRVEVPISDLPPSAGSYAQAIDWLSAVIFEY